MRPDLIHSPALAALVAGEVLASEEKRETPEAKTWKPQPSRGVLRLPRARESVPPAAVKRARRWLAAHKPGDTPPGHIADTLATLNMGYGS